MKKIIAILGIFLLSGLAFGVRVEGKIKDHQVQLGKISLKFVNAENTSYSGKSNFLGDYALEVPAGYYRIFLENTDYELVNSQQKVYHFAKNETLDLQVRQKPKTLEGMILDEEGFPIVGAKVIVKSSNEVETLESDRYGKFAAKSKADLLTILASKEGFIDGGEVIFVKAGSNIKNIQIVLRKQYSYIRGIVTDGTKALPGIPVRLRNENFEILAEVFSDSLGYYEFPKVENNRMVAVSVYEEPFQEYRSDYFFVDKNYDKEHIILRKS